jgi:hypothetical protein
MRYRLRTLLIVLAVLPPLVWVCWIGYWAFATEITRAMIPIQEVQPANFGDV